MLPFARKPDPRRVSKQVSREPPQAWLFGLVRSAQQAERKAPQASQFSAPQAGKIARSICCDLPALLARLLLALLSQSSASGRSLFTRRTAERGRKSFSCRISCESVCGFFFLLPPLRAHEGKPRRPRSKRWACLAARRIGLWPPYRLTDSEAAQRALLYQSCSMIQSARLISETKVPSSRPLFFFLALSPPLSLMHSWARPPAR